MSHPPVSQSGRFERIPTHVLPTAAAASRAVAGEIAGLIRLRQAQGRRCVLGLATGSTPTGVYAELIRMHREEGLSFQNVVTFNLDEYWPMGAGELQSYVRFMKEHLFDHLDIDPKNIHIPDGTLEADELQEFCESYEAQIAQLGGIDLQLLGIGRTGHIGFNEPGSPPDSRTRVIWLDRVTRLDAASDFFGIESVPRRAITMGVGSIMAARRIVLMAFGEGKAPVVAKAIEGEITSEVAASYLQKHPDVLAVLDESAAAHLKRLKSPWLVERVDWTPAQIRKAVIWLATELGKPILKLTEEDYNERGLQELLAAHGPAYNINVEIFRCVQETITGWPGGKPASARRPSDSVRPKDAIFPKRVLVFSPHPDDDVISMGGTLIRLVDQGHQVHVAYQVSGSIAVFDHDALRFMDFAADFNRACGIDAERSAELAARIDRSLRNKRAGAIDVPEVQTLKALIRRGEAKAAARHCGVPLENLHFLDMPFYETGTVRKKPLGEEDIQIIYQLLEEVRPHQIYAAGDLSDPHGTHRVCLTAVLEAVSRCRDADWRGDCEVWLYRGAWQEWEPEKIEMAVPLSPDELARKREAIFRHQSQKDRALFPGTDEREFWQRAEERNRATAQIYDKLGLADYEAIEAFVKWSPTPEPPTAPEAGQHISMEEPLARTSKAEQQALAMNDPAVIDDVAGAPPPYVRTRLSIMMFLELFIWGAWFVSCGNFMAAHGMKSAIYLAYVVGPIAAIVSPFFLGMVGDRYFASERILCVLHLVGAAAMLGAAAAGAAQSQRLFLAALLLHNLAYMPTLSITNTIALHHLRDAKKQFPLVRVFGTVGWIAANFVIGKVLGAERLTSQFYVAAASGTLLAMFSLALPHTPAPAKGKPASARAMLGLDSLALMKSPSFAIFIVSSFLICIPLAAYYAYAPVFAADAGFKSPDSLLLLGQVSEFVFMLAMPIFFVRLGVKYMLLLGMCAWAVRYALFAAAAPGQIEWMVVAGVLLHGLSYDFFFVTGFIYADKKASADIRGQVQGFLVLVTQGLGMLVGAQLSGMLFNSIVVGEGEALLHRWQQFWLIPCVAAAVVMAIFFILFRESPDASPNGAELP